MEQALSDLKIVEWGSFVSAPYCAKLMADLGAEVIKVEPPGTGDEARQHGPFPDDVPDLEKSGLYLYLNTNKRGVTLDPTQEAGRELFLKLIEDADVFVHNQPIKLLRRLKLGYNSLKKVNPRLIMTSITPFGQVGPYKDWKGYDINCNALGGITSAMGSPDREPLTCPQYQGDYQAGVSAAIATMIASFNRDLAGKGTHIDISEAECWATLHIGMAAQDFIAEGRVRKRSGHRAFHRPYLDEVLPCKDGYICLDTPQNRQWRKMLQVMGNPEWANDPIFEDRIKTSDEYGDKADAYMGTWLMQHTKEEIFKLFQDNRIPAAPIKTVEEVANDEHLKVRKYFVEMDHPRAGKLRYPGVGYKFSGTPAVFRRAAPYLGEHNGEIYGSLLGLSLEEQTRLREMGVI